jgi:hypothetical protein
VSFGYYGVLNLPGVLPFFESLAQDNVAQSHLDRRHILHYPTNVKFVAGRRNAKIRESLDRNLATNLAIAVT